MGGPARDGPTRVYWVTHSLRTASQLTVQEDPKISWATLLAPEAPWLSVLVGSRGQLDRFLEAQPAADLVVRTVPGDSGDDEDALLAAWSFAFDFPTVSNNWNSLVDWMRDLSWLPASQYVALVSDADRLLPDRDRFRQFMEVLSILALEGVRYRGSRPGRLRFALHAQPPNRDHLLLRLRQVGHAVPRFALA